MNLETKTSNNKKMHQKPIYWHFNTCKNNLPTLAQLINHVLLKTANKLMTFVTMNYLSTLQNLQIEYQL